MSILAVDAGTSEVKAAMIGAEGTAVSSASAPAPAPSRGGESVDPEDYWLAVAEAMRAAAEGRPAPDAVAVTGQGDGLWTLDRSGGPCDAFRWNSTAAAGVVRRWEADGTVEEHYRSSATVLWPGASAAVWRWLATERPEHAARVATAFCAKDWINYRLCGAVATDVTDATIPFLDLDSGDYSAESFARLGCEDLRGRVAAIRPVGDEIGRVDRGAAHATGLAEGTPVLMGCIDVAAVVHGSGVAAPGEALLALGTTAAALVIVDAVDRSGPAVGATLRLPGPDRYLRVLGTSSGTSTIDWCLDALRYHGDDRFEHFWADVADGRPGPYLMPYLAGERAPFLAPEATGALLGLTPGTRRADLARAAAAGVTFSLRHCLEEARPGRSGSTVVAGGGSRAASWCQLVADVTGTVVASDPRGAGACEGLARLVSGAPAASTDRFETYEPRRDHDAEYRRFVELGRLLRPVWAELAAAPPPAGRPA